MIYVLTDTLQIVLSPDTKWSVFYWVGHRESFHHNRSEHVHRKHKLTVSLDQGVTLLSRVRCFKNSYTWGFLNLVTAYIPTGLLIFRSLYSLSLSWCQWPPLVSDDMWTSHVLRSHVLILETYRRRKDGQEENHVEDTKTSDRGGNVLAVAILRSILFVYWMWKGNNHLIFKDNFFAFSPPPPSLCSE